MRLKRLELVGYKSFATRTELIFDSGITAIVGPNGSGKSNLADAVRWVLGEQSYSRLRGRRTEDMIFFGSGSRPPLGMAQVSITLDNADGRFPVDYEEITITRRAYRSGENEYLLNGNRLRLRDITELLAKGGLGSRSYVVIGQGLVDAILSLNPQERRSLFEEAAGLAIYKAKREAALNKLEVTHQNLLRVKDIINELTPRLKTLERQAERTREHERLSRKLEERLRTWYGYQWHRCQARLGEARAQARAWEKRVKERRAHLEKLEKRLADLRARRTELSARLEEWRREAEQHRLKLSELEKEKAVREERRRLLSRREEELRGELASLEEEMAAQKERMAATEEELARLEECIRQGQEEIERLREEREAALSRRQALEQELAQTRERAARLAADLAFHRQRLAQLEERGEALRRQREEEAQAIASKQRELARIREQAESLRAEAEALQGQLEALRAQKGEARLAFEAVEKALAELASALTRTKREEENLQARLESLRELRKEGAGYGPGVRAVLAASRSRLKGLVGVVAELIQVPERLEQAIEVALGWHLEDLVVESLADAEEAIRFLRNTEAGRATFLPLETLRPPAPLPWPQGPGILGPAVELVTFRPRLRPVFELLLGRTLVVEDLKAAWQALSDIRHMNPSQDSFQIVTLAGELIRESGLLIGGITADGRGGPLSRERQMRELAHKLGRVEKSRQGLEREAEAKAREREELLARQAELEEQIHKLEERWRICRSRWEARKAEAEALAHEIERWQALAGRLEDELKALEAERRRLEEETEALEEEKAELKAREEALEEERQGAQASKLEDELARRRTAMAIAEGNRRHLKALLSGQEAGLKRLERRSLALKERLEALSSELESLQGEVEEMAQRREELKASLEALEARIRPAGAELARLEETRMRLEEEREATRALLDQLESRHKEALLELGRRQEDVTRLEQRIKEDLGLVEVESGEAPLRQPPLPLSPLVSQLPHVREMPSGLEEEIRALKAQIRRLGAVNPEAPAEYEALLKRYRFLTSQVEDLEQGARSLKTLIAELEGIMERRFRKTFRAIAREFKAYFSTLFDGGSARLALTDPQDLMNTGVEILARPPGKRRQSLAMLSGGERALTAVALIFSILKVTPTPFCVLDEVDAMLDEVNIGRFRDALKALSQHTQFVVITHNRGTIEACDVVYGVSMGEDGVSTVVSLRLE